MRRDATLLRRFTMKRSDDLDLRNRELAVQLVKLSLDNLSAGRMPFIRLGLMHSLAAVFCKCFCQGNIHTASARYEKRIGLISFDYLYSVGFYYRSNIFAILSMTKCIDFLANDTCTIKNFSGGRIIDEMPTYILNTRSRRGKPDCIDTYLI